MVQCLQSLELVGLGCTETKNEKQFQVLTHLEKTIGVALGNVLRLLLFFWSPSNSQKHRQANAWDKLMAINSIEQKHVTYGMIKAESGKFAQKS